MLDRRARRLPGEGALDPDLSGVRNPHPLVDRADQQGGVLALDRDAAGLDQLHHTIDVSMAARNADADQATGGKGAQEVMVDDGCGFKGFGQMTCGITVGVVEPLRVGEHGDFDVFD